MLGRFAVNLGRLLVISAENPAVLARCCNAGVIRDGRIARFRTQLSGLAGIQDEY